MDPIVIKTIGLMGEVIGGIMLGIIFLILAKKAGLGEFVVVILGIILFVVGALLAGS